MKNRIFLDMYSRVRRNSRKQLVIKGLVLASIIALITLFSTNTVNTGSFLTVSEIREAESKVEIKPVSIKLPVKETKVLAEEKVETTEGKVEAQLQEAPVPAAPEAPAVQVAYTPQAAPVNYAQANTAYPTVLANGNSAGAVGSEAAAQMAAATGVPQATWEYIIARESNGNPSAANPSGASGLFQTMPGWGSTATVQDQINSAINAYNNQGLAAWGM